ncbi:uncharacterized protein C8Q71DRAFT_734655 [Rhodofomes roseus]|uniref:Anaphase-promoting complex subunit 5 n=1 Tax=Rhodofomes roseus TaxID=34475 RepID=A0ABQ8KUZ0_9APHY|nr:uncharacterized protein C8Q71DRAFT_734655 [Rhodofomes roseus]KAH9842804.1 hypothetical protein C8Q71DRAFT_734655 [Rhodofomes roseus]
MRNPANPPVKHILRPHHVNLLAIIVLAFQTFDYAPEGPLPGPFMLHLYRILIRELSEVMEPKGFGDLTTEIMKGPMGDLPSAQRFYQRFSNEHLRLQRPQDLSDFFANLHTLYVERDEEDNNSDFARRSLFGFFCHRCYISSRKLSFTGLSKLHRDYISWIELTFHAGQHSDQHPTKLPGYEDTREDALTMDYLAHKAQSDKKPHAVATALGDYEKAAAIGEENSATEHLRRFFEQHFHEAHDSGLRQHALLSVARRHYLHHEFVACRKTLQEAIGVARTCSDKLTLQACMSLYNRLPPTEHGQKPTINDIQPDLHPYEILRDVEKLLQISNQQPLTAAFERIIKTVGLYDHWINLQRAPFIEAEQWGPHTVQSVVWSLHGCARLAQIQENIVTAFTEVGGADNNRLTVALNRAYYRARQGKYEAALASLIDPDVWRGLYMTDYHIWANEIWHILVLRASRRGQPRQFTEFLKQRRPHGVYRGREYWNGTPMSLNSCIRDPMYEHIQMKEADQGYTWVEPLLTATWQAEFQCRFGHYRTALVLLADVALELGMTKWCRRIIEEILPQVIGGDDLEQRALTCFVFARCVIAAGDWTPQSLQESIPYLVTAEKDYELLDMFRQLQDVQYFLSVVYHNLGMVKERDATATRHLKADSLRAKATTVVLEDMVTEVWDLVVDVGAALAAR